MKHPIQPLGDDGKGVIRFKENKIVRFLLDAGPFDLNQIAMMEFTQDDRVQFAQLIGYSLSGFGELPYVDDETYNAASIMLTKGKTESDSRIETLEEALNDVRKGLRIAAPAVFQINPDDLQPTGEES